ncbi:helix-turn-helix domain-containing protein [Streptomyces sp. M2CJ-2]|uniref:helix-turn-helix transcriptional regulator n=1 Tax=Streptomyces sp. M2CJ-2 TaxID=2803948 RepID=UPI001923705B|nr:helix-turn-helix transcriptional regulator [Streptomyces sp. M2CJ-2]MBL3664572.1 helix-turn-helix domain-containing protein [Streptomyces sp. M2CJ-2]
MKWSDADWKRLGASLREAREARELSRRTLAVETGLSEKAIQTAEEGRVPSARWPKSIDIMADALGWTPGSARAVLDGDSPTSSDEQSVIGDVNATFAGWLKAERQRAGMSQDKLAVALRNRGLSITQSQIAKVERGERGVELGLAVAVTAVFGSTPDAALGLTPPGGDREQQLAKTVARRDNFLRALSVLVNSELEHGAP